MRLEDLAFVMGKSRMELENMLRKDEVISVNLNEMKQKFQR